MYSQPSPRDDRMKQVLELSAVDMSFRRRLLDAPHEAIRDAFGIHVPPHFRMRFVERDADIDALVVLPEPAATSDELDDADLDSVSGGNGWTEPDVPW